MNATSENKLSPRTKVTLVLLLTVGVSCYSAIRQLVRARKVASKQSAEELLLDRYAPLATVVPPDASVGYLVDREGFTRQPKYPEARIGLLRYAILPRLLVPSAEAEFIIFLSDRPAALPNDIQTKSRMLVADFRDGMKVYRRKAVQNQ